MDGEDDMSDVIESLVKTWLSENKHLDVCSNLEANL